MSIDALGEAWRQHLRLGILRVLESAPGYSANESLLTDALHALGFGATRDQVKTEIVWLCEQGCVTTSDVAGLLVPAITQRGLDVAAGRATLPGVKKPAPRG